LLVGNPFPFSSFHFYILTDKSLKIIVDMAAFHPRLKNERIQNYEELASYPFGPFGEKCVLYATFFMAVRILP
jgi:hypothetical protein